jgi:hypothetical protein
LIYIQQPLTENLLRIYWLFSELWLIYCFANSVWDKEETCQTSCRLSFRNFNLTGIVRFTHKSVMKLFSLVYTSNVELCILEEGSMRSLLLLFYRLNRIYLQISRFLSVFKMYVLLSHVYYWSMLPKTGISVFIIHFLHGRFNPLSHVSP